MTDNDREEEIRRRYRELAREEPPRALDEAILAAARRELETRPAPLVAPTGRRRWTVPIAAAAVIVLSAVLTLHVQREQPDTELGAPQISQAPARKDEAGAVAPRAEMQQDKLSAQPKEVEAQREKVEAPKVQPQRQRAQEASPAKAAKPAQPPAAESSALATAPAEPKPPADPGRFSPDPGPVAAAPPPPPASAPAPQMQMRQAAPALQPAPRASDSAGATAASPPAAAEERRAIGGLRDSPRFDTRTLAKREAVAEPPEKMLERIAVLRREGRQKEADDLYVEFRKRFPDYRIPEAMREQVLPR
ncbi:MAG TPA: hypothetical protein VGP71_01720 [Burkholderiales bacterium]|jgi:hypothetical protein|nr:hypothetical protein [Burkholderiales bacterium]